MGKRFYSGIAIGKLVAALLVLVIHVIPSPLAGENCPLTGGGMLQILSRSAVPFFFVSSAFLFYERSAAATRWEQWNNVKMYIKRILFIYLFWFVVNLPVTIYFRIWIFRDNLFKAVLNQLKAFFITSTFPGSWYLISCIFSVLLISLLQNHFNSQTIVLLTFPLELICIVTTQYGYAISQSMIWNKFISTFAEPHVSILAAPFYFAIGKWAVDWISTTKISSRSFGAMALLSYAGMVAEYEISRITNTYRTLNRCFSLIPFVIAIFVLAERYSVKRIVEIKFYLGIQRYSIFLFCTQWIYISALNVLERVNVAFSPEINYLIIVAVSAFCYKIFWKLTRIQRFSWMKKAV